MQDVPVARDEILCSCTPRDCGACMFRERIATSGQLGELPGYRETNFGLPGRYPRFSYRKATADPAVRCARTTRGAIGPGYSGCPDIHKPAMLNARSGTADHLLHAVNGPLQGNYGNPSRRGLPARHGVLVDHGQNTRHAIS